MTLDTNLLPASSLLFQQKDDESASEIGDRPRLCRTLSRAVWRRRGGRAGARALDRRDQDGHAAGDRISGCRRCCDTSRKR